MHLFPSLVGKLLGHPVGMSAASGPRSSIPPREGEFLKRMQTIAEQHLADPCFTTTDAAACLAMSRMHLNRKLRTITGKSTHQFIQTMRLESARTALLAQQLPVKVIAQRVGFRSTSHFAKAFRLKFGVSPLQYRKKNPADSPARFPAISS